MSETRKQVLVAVDMSRHANVVVDFAIYVARKTGLGMLITYVINESAYHMDADDPNLSRVINSESDFAHRQLEEFAQRAQKRGVDDCDIQVLYGNPKEVLVHAASAAIIDHVIIGAHGKHSVSDTVIGSTTDFVVYRSSKTVTVVKS
ncbi:universal stress protein [Furfurilactobacillus siliginis]|nr:universal stress protein [Furfurilactobacillus siliginis]GEK29421.1 universal stress protein [Furfurilactobacillus siliginis]